jgi:CRP/FNR family transcriptional regulator, cyclic AMP receptor protein
MARGKRAASAKAVAALGEVPLFSGLSDRELRHVASMAKEVTFPAGTEICREGEEGVGMHVVLDGETKVQIAGRTRRRMGPGAFFGEIALLDGGPRSATVIAETEVRTISIPFWTFKSTLKREPSMALKLLDEVCARLREEGSWLHA